MNKRRSSPVVSAVRLGAASFPHNPLLSGPAHVLDLTLAEQRLDADYIVYRLEEAGAAILALPNTGHSTAFRTSSLDVVRSAIEGYGWTERQIRPAIPSAERITRMDEAYAWLGLIPGDRYVLRRIVGARSLVSPITERNLFSWRRLAGLLGADHKAVQRWQAQGIDLILAALARKARERD